MISLRRSLAGAAPLVAIAALTLGGFRIAEAHAAAGASAAPVGSGGSAAPHPGPLPATADTTTLPAGHPAMPPSEEDDTDVEDSDPHGGGMGQGAGAGGEDQAAHANVPGIFQPPEDTEVEAPDLPAGTISVLIVTADNRPIPHAQISLGILHNSIAKGDSREKIIREAGDNGTFTFPGLETGSGIAYRINSPKDGGTYAALPFQLPAARGMRVVLHVYDASPKLEDARIVMQTAVYVEMKDDRVQIEEIFAVFNFGKVSWLPSPDLVIPLPPDYTAFNTQTEMSDTGADAVLGQGIMLHGTFSPGRHDITFRWQLPYDGESEVRFAVGLPPHVASSRVLAAAAPGMHLEVADFPTAQFRPDAQGTRVLATEKTIRPNDPPLSAVHVTLRDLPTAGPGRFIATGLASVGVLAGLAFIFGRRAGSNVRMGKGARKLERARLLEEIEDLERAFRTGEIGPKTYDRARRELIDLLATTLVDPAAATATATS